MKKTLTMFTACVMLATLTATTAAQTARNLGRDSSATVTASSTATGARNYAPAGAFDGDRKGLNWEAGGGWNDATRDAWPDWLQVSFDGDRQVTELRVYHLQSDFRNAVEPTPEMTTLNANRDFDVQYWDGQNWQTFAGGAIRGNDKVVRVVTLAAPVTTRAVRVLILAGSFYSKVVEFEPVGF